MWFVIDSQSLAIFTSCNYTCINILWLYTLLCLCTLLILLFKLFDNDTHGPKHVADYVYTISGFSLRHCVLLVLICIINTKYTPMCNSVYTISFFSTKYVLILQVI